MDYYTLCNSLIVNDSVFYKKISEKLEFYSYGCPDSRWDLETITGQLDLDSIKEDITIIDVCAATDEQEKISKAIVNRITAIYPDKKYIITGCGVNYDREFYKKYGLTLDNSQKFDLDNYPLKSTKIDIFKIPHSHGAVKIQDGCFNRCSYCAIKNFRCHYTYSKEDISKQVETSIQNGENHILLFGTEICEWKKDKEDLVDLCKYLLEKFPQISIKLDSINPGFNRIFELIDLIKNNLRMDKDIDLSVQSCSNKILKEVKRKYSVEKLFEIKNYIDNTIFMPYQLIVGLPGESDEVFEESFSNIKKLNPSMITLCKFSPRKNTELYNSKNRISEKLIDKRESLIRNLFCTKDKNTCIEFAKYRPQNYSNNALYVDLYSPNDLSSLYYKLDNYNSKPVIITRFNKSKNQEDLAINIKLLMAVFGLKIIVKLEFDDDIIKNFSILDFVEKVPSYLEIDFDKLKTTDNKEIYNLLKNIQEYQLDDIESIAIRLIKKGNVLLARKIINKFNISI